MDDLDDMALKAEIDQISQKIDAIVEKVQQLDPARQKEEEVQENEADTP